MNQTGTNSENMSVWFMGYTPELATASMIAGANSMGHWITLNGQDVGGTYIYAAHGSTTAGPMWGDAMKKISTWLKGSDFVTPSGTDIAGIVTSLPDVNGMSIS